MNTLTIPNHKQTFLNRFTEIKDNSKIYEHYERYISRDDNIHIDKELIGECEDFYELMTKLLNTSILFIRKQKYNNRKNYI